MRDPREIGGLFVPNIRLPGDYARADELAGLARESGVAGFIVYGGDADIMPAFLDRLRSAAGRPLLVMADYERGAGKMVPGMPELPPAMALGAGRSAEHAYLAGRITALSARSLGVNVVLAPVLDVLSRPENPIIGTRAFSDDPDLVAKLALALAEGIAEEGVMACGKHLPGHGDTELDSHVALPRVTAPREVLDRRELPPFRAAARAGIGMLMTAHVVYDALDPGVPATFSRRILVDLLRQEWGYGGLVITDALSMAGAKAGPGDPAVRALAAGVDLVLGPDDPAASMRAVAEALDRGELSAEALALSRGRVAMAAGDLAADAPVLRDLGREYGFPIAEMSRRSLTVLRDPDGLLAKAPRSEGRVMGIVVDDDGLPARARALDPCREAFGAGVVHVTAEGTGVAGGLAEALREASLIVLALTGDVRMGKGRAGLAAPLRGFAAEVLGEHAAKTVVLVLGNPCLLAGLPARTAVLAWGDGEATRREALTALFEGRAMPGRLPLGRGAEAAGNP